MAKTKIYLYSALTIIIVIFCGFYISNLLRQKYYKDNNLIEIKGMLLGGDAIPGKGEFCSEEVYIQYNGVYYQIKDPANQKSGIAKGTYGQFLDKEIHLLGLQTLHSQNCTPKDDCRCDERLLVKEISTN